MSSSTTSADAAPVAPAERPSLICRDLSAGYDGTVALEGVDGTVGSGQALALVGPNGAGKTTFIRSVLGLVDVISGSIEVLGTTPALARADVAYVPQADALDRSFPVSVADVVGMGRYRRIGWLRRPGKDDRSRVEAALVEVGLADRADERFGVLSGGQRQRVLLARAIAQEARLLLLDEPFNGVDTTTIDVLLGVLSRLRDAGAAVVMSTHDLDVARASCDLACVINRRQVSFGPIESSLTAEVMGKAHGRGWWAS
jgi:manganese/iron transport system ATP-binding protein